MITKIPSMVPAMFFPSMIIMMATIMLLFPCNDDCISFGLNHTWYQDDTDEDDEGKYWKNFHFWYIQITELWFLEKNFGIFRRQSWYFWYLIPTQQKTEFISRSKAEAKMINNDLLWNCLRKHDPSDQLIFL